jgi:O-antigen/teichoic acid export membrane protein
MLALVLAAPFLSDDASVVQGIQISAPLVLIAPFYGAFTAIFRAYRIMWPIVWLNLGMLLAQVIFTALVFLGGGDVIAALVVNVVTSAAQLAAAWAVWRWKFQQMSEAGLATTIGMSMGNILRRAWPFALAGILAAVQLRFSVILLERLARAGEVGYYAAAIRFIEAGRMIPNALFGALFPILAALAAQPQMMSATFRRVMLGLTIFGAALGVIVTLLAPVIITLTYGEEFLPAAPVLQIAMWTLLPSLLRSGRTLYWYALEQEQFVNVVTVVTLVLQIALGLWLIPMYGAVGAAAVNLVIEGAAFAWLMWPMRRVGREEKENALAG